jgi:hypothetical protein
VLMTDPAHMPATTSIPNLLCFDELLDAQDMATAGPNCPRRPPRPSATPPGTTATRRARSTAIARRCCTRTPPRCPTR